MSHKATAWAFDQNPQSPVQKFVLICLADCHNSHTGQCNPSVNRLATVTGYSRRAVINALQALEQQGFIWPTKAHGRSSNYALSFQETGALDAPVQHPSERESAHETGARRAPVDSNVSRETGASGAPVHDMHQCTSDTEVVHQVHGGGAPRAPESGKNREENREDEEHVVRVGDGWIVKPTWTPPEAAIARARAAAVPRSIIDDPGILDDFRLKYSEAPQRDPAFSKRWVSWVINEHRNPRPAGRAPPDPSKPGLMDRLAAMAEEEQREQANG